MGKKDHYILFLHFTLWLPGDCHLFYGGNEPAYTIYENVCLHASTHVSMYVLEVIPKVRYHTKDSYLKMNIWMKDFC